MRLFRPWRGPLTLGLDWALAGFFGWMWLSLHRPHVGWGVVRT